MNEQDYLKATNRAKVSMALNILRDILPGEEWGISEIEYGKIMGPLMEAEKKLFASFELVDSE